jgi:hypothetical protein
MRNCVSCGKYKYKGVEFVDIQCRECWLNEPVVYEVVKRVEIKRVYKLRKRVPDKVINIKEKRCCKICRLPGGLVKFEGDGYMKINVHKECYYNKKGELRLLAIKNELIKEKKMKKIKVCRVCGLPPIEGNGFSKSGLLHKGCRKVSGPYKSLEEKMPERMVCIDCGKDKHCSDYYIHKKGGSLFHRCKMCHAELSKKWSIGREEEIRVYHKDYNRNYVRKPVKRKRK